MEVDSNFWQCGGG